MSISNALNNAATGLAASARAVQVVSANIANALTEGYAARRMALTPSVLNGVGAGVRVAGIERQTNPALTGLLRDAGAAAAAGGQAQAFWQRIEDAVGLPGEGLSAALSAFDTALIAASERPDLDSRLAAVADAAVALAGQLGRVEDTVQDLRASADAAIARDVRSLNEGLVRIDELNDQIIRLQQGGTQALALLDERDALVSRLSAIVPMREYPRADGRIMLYSAAGEMLLDVEPAVFGFIATPAIDATMSNGAGLSGLTINGKAVATGPTGPIGGGSLATGFALRDGDAPAVQAQLDTFAADLITRFADPATDPTLTGGPGLFTDAGGLAGAAPGLAGRLAVNAAVLADQGGALWRLRDGIGAAGPGPVGEPSQIARLSAALDRQLASGPGGPLQDSAGTLGALLTSLSRDRQAAEDRAVSATLRRDVLAEEALAQGVDTDAEMQRLLLIEEAYAANARVIQTADSMLRTLLEI